MGGRPGGGGDGDVEEMEGNGEEERAEEEVEVDEFGLSMLNCDVNDVSVCFVLPSSASN